MLTTRPSTSSEFLSLHIWHDMTAQHQTLPIFVKVTNCFRPWSGLAVMVVCVRVVVSCQTCWTVCRSKSLIRWQWNQFLSARWCTSCPIDRNHCHISRKIKNSVILWVNLYHQQLHHACKMYSSSLLFPSRPLTGHWIIVIKITIGLWPLYRSAYRLAPAVMNCRIL